MSELWESRMNQEIQYNSSLSDFEGKVYHNIDFVRKLPVRKDEVVSLRGGLPGNCSGKLCDPRKLYLTHSQNENKNNLKCSDFLLFMELVLLHIIFLCMRKLECYQINSEAFAALPSPHFVKLEGCRSLGSHLSWYSVRDREKNRNTIMQSSLKVGSTIERRQGDSLPHRVLFPSFSWCKSIYYWATRLLYIYKGSTRPLTGGESNWSTRIF